MTVSYEQDLSLWARQTADLLRAQRWQEIDRAHLIEELEQLAPCYQRARRSAARQTGLLPEHFPEDCPYTLEQILDEDWLPE